MKVPGGIQDPTGRVFAPLLNSRFNCPSCHGASTSLHPQSAPFADWGWFADVWREWFP